MAPAYQEGMKRFGLCNRGQGRAGQATQVGLKCLRKQTKHLAQRFCCDQEWDRSENSCTGMALLSANPLPSPKEGAPKLSYQLLWEQEEEGGVRLKSCQQSEFESWGQTLHSFAITMASLLVRDSSPPSDFIKCGAYIFLYLPFPVAQFPPASLVLFQSSPQVQLSHYPSLSPACILPYLLS